MYVICASVSLVHLLHIGVQVKCSTHATIIHSGRRSATMLSVGAAIKAIKSTSKGLISEDAHNTRLKE